MYITFHSLITRHPLITCHSRTACHSLIICQSIITQSRISPPIHSPQVIHSSHVIHESHAIHSSHVGFILIKILHVIHSSHATHSAHVGFILPPFATRLQNGVFQIWFLIRNEANLLRAALPHSWPPAVKSDPPAVMEPSGAQMELQWSSNGGKMEPGARFEWSRGLMPPGFKMVCFWSDS